MKKESSGSPAFAFVICAIACLIGIAFGFYFGGEKGYAAAAFGVAVVFFAIGIIELLDVLFFHPVLNVALTVLSDPEDMDID